MIAVKAWSQSARAEYPPVTLAVVDHLGLVYSAVVDHDGVAVRDGIIARIGVDGCLHVARGVGKSFGFRLNDEGQVLVKHAFVSE